MVMLLWVPGHSAIQGNVDADALAKNGLSILFLGPEPAIIIKLTISPYVGMLIIKEWLTKKPYRV
jgi:hypothetical protein